MNVFAVLRNRLTRYFRRLTASLDHHHNRHYRDLRHLKAREGDHQISTAKIKKATVKTTLKGSPKSCSLLAVILTTVLVLFLLGLALLVLFTSPQSAHRDHQHQDHHLHIEPPLSGVDDDRAQVPDNLEQQQTPSSNSKPQQAAASLQIEPASSVEDAQTDNQEATTTENQSTDQVEKESSLVDVLTLGRVTSDAERAERETGFARHAFNTLISDRLGLRRPLPDTRHELCKSQRYDNLNVNENSTDKEGVDKEGNDNHQLLTTSVIICFHNEHFATLQRTVYSVLERTPRHLLQEIILVDDYSNETLVTQLAHYFKEQSASNPTGFYHSKVHLRRLPERAGLIRARLYGTRFATGRVLLFLDSHCEVNSGWLEPLLARISQNRKTIACPIIDLIDPETLQYKPSPLVRGGFNWGLHFKWDSIENLKNEEDFIRPVSSPTMAGGLFAIERKYFQELGEYDEGMRIWGGENLELSFRAWMCGGRLEIVPCSRVGHIFRKRRPYGGENSNGEAIDTLAYNSLRVAHVWMDDYKKYFLASRSDLARMDYGDIRERLDLRRRLNCSTFEWYLQHVYPELQTPEQAAQSAAEADKKNQPKNLFKPDPPPKTIGQTFSLQLTGSKFCLEAASDSAYRQLGSTGGSSLLMAPCARASRLQRWRRTEAEDIRLGPKACLAVSGDRRLRVGLGKCHQQGGSQLWQIEPIAGSENSSTVQLYNPGAGLCLGVVIKNRGENGKSTKTLKDLVNSELIKPKTAAALLQLKMSFCKSAETEQGPEYTSWKMQSV